MASGQDILTKASMTIPMAPRQFKSGSDGFFGQGKVVDGEQRYQVQVTAVRIGSKPAQKSAKK